MTINSVDSCSNYTFAVRCAVAGAIWSNWSQEKTVLTPLNGKNCCKSTLNGSCHKHQDVVKKKQNNNYDLYLKGYEFWYL